MTKKQKVVDLVTRIRHIFRNKEGNRLDFETRPHWKRIYNDESRYMVLMTSRQIGKSTFQAIRILYEMLATRSASILFANAKKSQNNEFRHRSLLPQIFRNRKLMRKALGKASINNTKISNRLAVDGAQAQLDLSNIQYNNTDIALSNAKNSAVLELNMAQSQLDAMAYNYSNLTTNTIGAYVVFKSGDSFQELLDDIFKKKVRIKVSI